MKKLLFCLCLIFVCTLVSPAAPIEIDNVEFSMSDMTADNQTDRIIGKYTNPNTGMQEYRPVKVKDVVEYIHCPTVGGKKKTYFKCYNETANAIVEMEYVQPDYIRHLCNEADDELTTDDNREWGIKRISSEDFTEKLSERFKNSKDVVTVAIVDTGTDLNHSFLRGRLVKGYDFVDDDDNPMNADGEEHGTHVSGIIKAFTPENVKIMPVRVLGNDGGYDYDIAQGILYAVTNGADVINLSFGGPGYSPIMDMAINYALSKDVVVVASAGNDALDTKTMFPAQKKEIIVVSATNKDDDISLFSDYGDSIDVCAPGEEIYSSIPGDKFALKDGTSMAAPFVSAICAMLKLEEKNRSVAEIESILKTYTDDLGTPGWDKAFGEGLVNMDAYFSPESNFRLISPTKENSYCDSVSVKYFTRGNIGATVKFYIDSSLKKTIKVQSDGFDTQVLNLNGVRSGEHTIRVELTTTSGNIISESINITKLAFNTSFELLDIYNERMEGPLVYLYWLKDGKSGHLHVEKQKIKDNIVYMDLDMNNLLKKYDKIVATASADSYNSDNLDAPFYIKNIVSTGKKTFAPDSLQSVRVFEEIPFDLYGDGLSTPYNQVIITPFIDGQYINMELPIMKNFPGSDEFYIEQGAHKVNVSTPYYKSVVQLDGYGTNEIVLTGKETTKITVAGIKGKNGDVDGNSFFYHVQKRGIVDISVFNGYLYEEGESQYVGDGNYVVSMCNITNGDIVNFKKYFTLNSAKSGKYNIKAGGTITNQFIINYSNSNLNVNLYFKDTYDNIVTSFWLKQGGGMKILYPDLVLKGKGKSYIGSVVRADVPGIETYGYSFAGQNIPDGDYILQVKLESPIPIYKSQFTDMPVKIKGGRFTLQKSNSAPHVVEQTVVASVDKYETVDMNLKNLFKDADGDKLYYKVNKGYVQNDKYYLETSNVGIQEVEITAMDYKGGSASIKVYVLVNDGLIFYLPEPDKDKTINLNGASIDVVSELLDAYNNNLLISRLAGSYDQNTTREEFCELVMRFYYEAGGKEISKLPKNPFIDTKNPDVLKAYSIGAMKGVGKGRFAPGESITRLQACEAIAAVIEELKPDISQKNTYTFSDSGKLSALSQERLGFCYGNGILQNSSPDKIIPDGPVPRENALVMVNRAYNKFFKESESP